MTVTLPTGRTVKLNFIHSSPNFVTQEGASIARVAIDELARELGRRLTQCEISQVAFSGTSEQAVSDLSYTSLGIAVCHPNDTFDKALGRKYAVEKALLAADFTYDERAAVWAAYRAEFTGPTVESVLKTIAASVALLVDAGEVEALESVRQHVITSEGVARVNVSRGRFV